jgi:UDP-N-acetylmuramate: L-alanyl-gamma-D-glutamyl-meso-diaminopimelate ligase
MLAWILEDCGLKPGFLIGGVPQNFGVSARLGDTPFFVVEADEYDTAFFDKRAKFVHYRPRTAVLNNLEFDHADIYDSLSDIETQFHHLVRTVPGNGKLVVNAAEPALERVLARGNWSETEFFADAGGWDAKPRKPDCSVFEVTFAGELQGTASWDLVGEHNMDNALAAIAAARHAGVAPANAIQALARFRNTRRRLELLGQPGGISVYDDFAHHPTAIRLTLGGLRARVGAARIVAVLDIRSNSMKMGVHKDGLAECLQAADRSIVLQPEGLEWDLAATLGGLGDSNSISHSVDEILELLKRELRAGDHVLIMSNGGFGGLHRRLLDALGKPESQ